MRTQTWFRTSLGRLTVAGEGIKHAKAAPPETRQHHLEGAVVALLRGLLSD